MVLYFSEDSPESLRCNFHKKPIYTNLRLFYQFGFGTTLPNPNHFEFIINNLDS